MSEIAGEGDMKGLLSKPPKGLIIKEKNGKLTIQKSWYSGTAVALFVGMLIWTGLSFAGIIGIIFFMEGIGKLFIGIIPFFFVGLGSFVLSKIAMGVFNKSTIIVTADKLRVETRPLPNKTNKSLKRHEIKQLFVKGVNYEANASSNSAESEATKVYGLYYIDMHGQTKPLFMEVPVFGTPLPAFKPEEGRYLEQKVEQFWALEDEEVKDLTLSDVAAEKVVGAKEERTSVLPVPSGLDLLEDGESLIIQRAWKTPIAYIFFLMATFVGGFGVFMFISVLLGDTASFFNGIMVAAVSVFLLVAGGYLLLKGLAFIFNKTTIHVTPTSFQLRHAPFYWNKGVNIPLGKLEKVYTEEEKVVSKNHDSGGSRTYYVNVLKLKKIGEPEPIVLGSGGITPTDTNSLYIAYKVEEYLKRIRE
ncbi:MAG: hypothetical protein GY810_02585 [Aureispira sp.]|nr:hypothetical protein [Aureispira sp.]